MVPRYDVLVRGGTVVNAHGGQQSDVAVKGETIAAVAPDLPGDAPLVVDAGGLYVFPGFIDPHVHFSLPIGNGLVSKDDFLSGTIAAACGGTTTIIDFTTQPRGVSLHEALAQRRAEAEGRAVIDYGLHLTVMDADQQTLSEITELAAGGCPSLKLYLTYSALMVSDDAMVRIMETAAACGALVLVHAENHQVVTHLTGRLLAQGRTAVRYHAVARPPWAEGEATGRAITLARAVGGGLYVVHVSCPEALEPIAAARQRGQPVFGETCPHYLLLSDEEYKRRGLAGAKYVMTPPLRDGSNRQVLWDALAAGILDVVATDHCPWDYHRQKQRGRSAFNLIPGGVAGIETRPMLLLGEGAAKGRLSLERLTAVLSTNAARLFGLYPRKGLIAPGSDADLVLVDPVRQFDISRRRLHQNVDYTVFEGWRVQGAPVLTMSRGRIVARDGAFMGEPGWGRFLKRAPRSEWAKLLQGL